MQIFEDIFNLSASIAFVAIGVGIIIFGVNLHFLVPRIPKSKRWAKTRAKIVGVRDYTEKAPPSKYDYRSGVKLIRGREKIIEYTADGKIYKKAVPEEHKGAAHIYYKKSNPNYFKTVYELKRHRRDVGGVGVFVTELFLAAFFLWLGISGVAEYITGGQ